MSLGLQSSMPLTSSACWTFPGKPNDSHRAIFPIVMDITPQERRHFFAVIAVSISFQLETRVDMTLHVVVQLQSIRNDKKTRQKENRQSGTLTESKYRNQTTQKL
jgi:hypothetical protein